MKAPKVEQNVYRQDDRDAALLANPQAKAFRKTARVLAVQQDKAFMVYTDRGPMTGQPGDWLVTNHPSDDPGSDLWTISAERMGGTYEPVTGGPHPGSPHRFETICLDCRLNGQLHVSILTPNEHVTISEA